MYRQNFFQQHFLTDNPQKAKTIIGHDYKDMDSLKTHTTYIHTFLMVYVLQYFTLKRAVHVPSGQILFRVLNQNPHRQNGRFHY